MNGILSKKTDLYTKPNPPAPATGNRLTPITLGGLGPGRKGLAKDLDDGRECALLLCHHGDPRI